jgi:hypothetical protein
MMYTDHYDGVYNYYGSPKLCLDVSSVKHVYQEGSFMVIDPSLYRVSLYNLNYLLIRSLCSNHWHQLWHILYIYRMKHTYRKPI